jgi:hypothetical protein
MVPRHSATCDALIDVTNRLSAATFPPHPTTGRLPKVGAENDKIGEPDEWVDLDVMFDDGQATIEWARVGRGAVGLSDERFWVDIVVKSTVPGDTRISILERLRDLKQAVEDMFFEPTTGTPIPVGEGLPWATQLGGISTALPQAYRTDQGWAGSVLIRVQVVARI